MIFITINAIFAVVSIYAMFRNHWVYKYRTRIIDEDFRNHVKRVQAGNYDDSLFLCRYRALPDYGLMLWQFWKWDYLDYFKGME